MARSLLGLVVLVLALSAMSGCLSAQYTQIGAQSHFDYPNSNIRPLGPVKVKIPGRTTLFGTLLPTAEDDERLYDAALAEVHGADLIIDYVKIWRKYSFIVSWCEMEIEGTAADMEVGQQKLR